MPDPHETSTVGEIVASDFRTGAVFERFGIDFCCGGRRSLADACRAANVDLAVLVEALGRLEAAGPASSDEAALPLDRLIDHIVSTHHAYVRTALPDIARYLGKLASVHGERHPELARVSDAFGQVGDELTHHMFKEEQILFPYIAGMLQCVAARQPLPPSPFGTVANPIRMMEQEHQDVGDQLQLIRELTRGYQVPSDGCSTYAVAMAELVRFEQDLHRHIHLENNVLFPRAVAVEHDLTARN